MCIRSSTRSNIHLSIYLNSEWRLFLWLHLNWSDTIACGANVCVCVCGRQHTYSNETKTKNEKKMDNKISNLYANKRMWMEWNWWGANGQRTRIVFNPNESKCQMHANQMDSFKLGVRYGDMRACARAARVCVCVYAMCVRVSRDMCELRMHGSQVEIFTALQKLIRFNWKLTQIRTTCTFIAWIHAVHPQTFLCASPYHISERNGWWLLVWVVCANEIGGWFP